ncbi:MAG: BREX-1 system adenine-specific DNA-methyltransferase PglX [Shewanella xiamenensis]|nr:BREX-1 system adenine-specific DNA-methyltransferase PglX [Shewanella xiamenensis]
MTLFINLSSSSAKDSSLLCEIQRIKNCEHRNTFDVDHKVFSLIHGSPFSYWVSSKVRSIFGSANFTPLESEGRDVQSGATTGDDFRFLRLFWEVPPALIASSRSETVGTDKRWVFIPKGGGYSKFYSSWHLVCNWDADGKEIKESVAKYRGDKGWGYNWSAALNGHDQYFRPGITWSRRTTSGLSMRVMPLGCIFADKGPAIFSPEDDEKSLMAILSLSNSRAFEYLVELQLAAIDAAARSYEVGIIENMPIPLLSTEIIEKLSDLSKRAWHTKLELDSINEVSPFFKGATKSLLDCSDHTQESLHALGNIQKELDEICFDLYQFSEADKSEAKSLQTEGDAFDANEFDTNRILSYCVGLVFGRYDYAESSKFENSIASLNPFTPLSMAPLLKGFSEAHGPKIHRESILKSENLVQELVSFLSNENLLDLNQEKITKWLDQIYFDYHLKMYSKSRRQAPIYWPLQTPSGSYTLWVYYHRLNEQTLYTCVNDFVEPKLEQVEQDLNGLRSKSARSSQEEKELEKLSDLASELRDFRDELLRLAKFWKPNLNDGVQITAAPLWKLFQHKAWQKKLKETWESLEKGDYDWAHLACSIWPERVLRKCHQDRSLAIAHDVEAYFWHEVELPVKRGKKLTDETKLEWQPKDLSEGELNALVKKLAAEVK